MPGFNANFNQGFNRNFNGDVSPGGIVVPQDGPDNWYYPNQAAHWTALGIDVPANQNDLSIASGNATALIGSLALTANGTPLYQQTPSTGTWNTVRGVGFSQVNAQRFALEAGVGPDAATESIAWLMYCHDFTVPAVTGRAVFSLSSPPAGSAAWIDHTTGNLMRFRTSAGSPAFVNQPAANFMMLVVWNRTASTYRCYTTQEQVNGTFDGAVAAGRKGLGGALNSGSASSTGKMTLSAWWTGAQAETKDKTLLQALGGTVPY